jgi:hypothetical protein
MATVMAALIAAFLGSALGAWTALQRFRKERSFDRRLDWHERAVRAVFTLAQRIEIASTFQDEKNVGQEFLEKMWRKVQDAHLAIDDVANEAGLYGSDKAVNVITSVATLVQELADETEGLDPLAIPPSRRRKALEKIDALPDRLRQEISPVVKETRALLGIR